MKLSVITGFIKQKIREAITGNKGEILKEGQPAPEFSVSDESGNRHELKNYRGRKILLWFFPRAATPG